MSSGSAFVLGVAGRCARLHARLELVRSAPAIAAGALGLALLVEAAGLSRSLHSKPPSPASQTVPVPRASQMHGAQTIVQAHLFGTSAEPHRSADSAATAQATLVLTGVIALTDPAHGAAIIGTDNASRLFQAGARLPDGSRMRAVFADRVVLEREGIQETLYLHKREGGRGPLAVRAALRREPPAEEDAFGVTRNPRNFTAARRWFNGFLARQAPLLEGKFQGFALRPMPRYKRQYGVRDGDIVTAINGIPLEDADAAARVLQEATGATVSITILRDGVAQDLTFNVGS